MKNLTLRAMVVFGVLASCAFAQDRATAKVNVPFSFRIGATVMPAGEYTVSQNLRNGLVSLAAVDGEQSAAAITNACQKVVADPTGKLVFHRYGNTYFLSQIWHASENYGRQFSVSTAEREVAKGGNAQVAMVRMQ